MGTEPTQGKGLIKVGSEALHLARALDGQGSSDELMMAMDERVTKIVLDAVREAVAESPALLEELGLEQVGFYGAGVVQTRYWTGAVPVFRVRPDA